MHLQVVAGKNLSLRAMQPHIEGSSSAEGIIQSCGCVANAGTEEEELRKRIYNWHLANLEFANAASIEDLSVRSWDQDDPHELSGPHCFLPGPTPHTAHPGFTAEENPFAASSSTGSIFTSHHPHPAIQLRTFKDSEVLMMSDLTFLNCVWYPTTASVEAVTPLLGGFRGIVKGEAGLGILEKGVLQIATQPHVDGSIVSNGKDMGKVTWLPPLPNSQWCDWSLTVQDAICG